MRPKVANASPARSAVGIRLHRDSMVGLAHPDLVGCGAAQLEAPGRSAGALDLELQVGNRAVERVVLRPLGVGVDPGDEVPGLGRDPPAQLQVLSRKLELAGGGALGDL